MGRRDNDLPAMGQLEPWVYQHGPKLLLHRYELIRQGSVALEGDRILLTLADGVELPISSIELEVVRTICGAKTF